MIRRRKAPKMGTRTSSVVKCASHLKWVRGHQCSIDSKTTAKEQHFCQGKIEAHHVISRGAGGGDEQVVPLCSKAHALVHSMGVDTFAREYGVDLAKIAVELWQRSPHRRKNEQERAP